jgi:hypothetical protein
MSQEAQSVDEAIRLTAEVLKVEASEVDWITEETIASLADARELQADTELEGLEVHQAGDDSLEARANSNRNMDINSFTSVGTTPWLYFKPQCNIASGWWYININQLADIQRNGTCANGAGGYIYRYHLWWRA